ncbi:MAG: hypothetical protein AAF764_06675, partial [Pseudomonadota bacterium]
LGRCIVQWLAGERARSVRAGRAMVCQGNGGETPSAAEPKWGVTGDRFAETTGMGQPSRPTGSRRCFGSETDAEPEVRSAGGRFGVSG